MKFLVIALINIRNYFRSLRALWLIDPNSKCPACGARDGEIKFSRDVKIGALQGGVVHHCKIDDAVWVTPPLVPYSEWIVGVQTDPADLFKEAKEVDE